MQRGDAATPGEPLVHLVKMIVWSPEGQQAAIDGTKGGLPVRRSVEALLTDRYPEVYSHPTRELHELVEAEVAEMMRHLGYVE